MSETQTQGNLALMPNVPSIPEVPAEKVNELMTSATQLLVTAKGQGKITSPEQFAAVNDELVKIKDYKKQVTDLFKEPKAKAHEAHAAICDSEKKLLAPALQAEQEDSKLILDYNREQDRIRREREAEARQKAEEQAAREREEKMKVAEAAMDAEASVEEIQLLIQEAETVIPVFVPPAAPAPKPVGLVIKENWTYEITDVNLIPRQFMVPNTAMIGATVKAQKNATNIPGIRVYDSGSVAKAR